MTLTVLVCATDPERRGGFGELGGTGFDDNVGEKVADGGGVARAGRAGAGLRTPRGEVTGSGGAWVEVGEVTGGGRGRALFPANGLIEGFLLTSADEGSGSLAITTELP